MQRSSNNGLENLNFGGLTDVFFFNVSDQPLLRNMPIKEQPILLSRLLQISIKTRYYLFLFLRNPLNKPWRANFIKQLCGSWNQEVLVKFNNNSITGRYCFMHPSLNNQIIEQQYVLLVDDYDNTTDINLVLDLKPVKCMGKPNQFFCTYAFSHLDYDMRSPKWDILLWEFVAYAFYLMDRSFNDIEQQKAMLMYTK